MIPLKKTSVTVTELPPECNDYLILDDSTRNVNHGSERYCDVDNHICVYDTSPDWQGGNNWYRMMPPAGVVMTETSLEYNHCGTKAPGWIRGTHPTDEGEQLTVEVCFIDDTGNGNDCSWSQNFEITHCGEYYVYFLPEFLLCIARYCGADTL